MAEQTTVSEGARLIAEERERQVRVEGWTPEHDDGHVDAELAWAAVCYAAPGPVRVERPMLNGTAFVDPWPFPQAAGSRYGSDWDRRKNGPLGYGNTVREMPAEGPNRLDFLVRAGALIAAEIDRLQRAGAS